MKRAISLVAGILVSVALWFASSGVGAAWPIRLLVSAAIGTTAGVVANRYGSYSRSVAGDEFVTDKETGQRWVKGPKGSRPLG
jgi:hypothetical protein